MKDVIPRPSHPSKRNIRCGMKIIIFIDSTNAVTRWINRCIRGSPCM